MTSELQRRKDLEYEMQLFGFTSTAVAATLERVVDEKIENCCKKLGDSLRKLYAHDESIASVIESNEKNLIRAYSSHSKPHIEVMKKCIQKLIAIPCNVLLEEDSCQRNAFSEEEFQKIKKHLEDLQLRVRRAKVLQAALEEEIHLLDEFGSRENEVELLSSIIDNSVLHTGIDNNTIKVVENCQIFQEILEESETNNSTNLYNTNIPNMCIKEIDLSTVNKCN